MLGVKSSTLRRASGAELGMLLLATVLIPTRLALISFLILLIALCRYVPRRAYGRFHQLVWGYTYFAVIVAALYMLAWIAQFQLSSGYILAMMSVVAWGLVFTRAPAAQSVSDDNRKLSALMIVVPLIICMFVALPVLRHPSTATVLRYAAHTGDDINHIAMIETTREVGGYLYTSDRQKHADLIEFRYVNYPQGWHVNGAFLETLLSRAVGSDGLGIKVASYFGYSLLWLFLAVYLLVELTFSLLRLLVKQVSVKKFIVLAGLVTVLAASLLIPLFGYGFQTFIATIVFLLGSIVLAVEYLGNTKKQRPWNMLVGMALLFVGATYSWLLSGFTIGLLLAVIIFHARTSIMAFLRALPWQVWLSWGIAVGLSFMQLFVQLRLSSKSASSIDSDGAVPPLSTLATALLVVVTLLLLYRLVSDRRWLAWLLAAVSFEWIALALYQQLTYGTQYYYVIKLGFSVALVASVFLLATLAALTDSRQNKTWQIALVAGFLIIPLALGLNPKKSAYPLKDSAPISHSFADRLLREPSTNQELVILTDRPEESYLATKLWSSAWTNNSQHRQALLRSLDAKLHE